MLLHVESIICLHWAAHNELYIMVQPQISKTCHALKISCLWNIISIVIKSQMFWLNLKWSWLIIHNSCNYLGLNSYKKVIYMVLNYWIHAQSHVWMNTHHMVTHVAKKHSWNTLKFHTDVNTTCNTNYMPLNLTTKSKTVCIKLANSQTRQPFYLFMLQCMLGRGLFELNKNLFIG